MIQFSFSQSVPLSILKIAFKLSITTNTVTIFVITTTTTTTTTTTIIIILIITQVSGGNLTDEEVCGKLADSWLEERFTSQEGLQVKKGVDYGAAALKFFQRGAIKKESVTKVGLVDQPTSSSPPTTLLNLFPFTFSHIIIFLRRFKRAAGLNGRVLCVCPAQGLDIRYFSILGNCILQHSVTVFARGLVFININH